MASHSPRSLREIVEETPTASPPVVRGVLAPYLMADPSYWLLGYHGSRSLLTPEVAEAFRSPSSRPGEAEQRNALVPQERGQGSDRGSFLRDLVRRTSPQVTATTATANSTPRTDDSSARSTTSKPSPGTPKVDVDPVLTAQDGLGAKASVGFHKRQGSQPLSDRHKGIHLTHEVKYPSAVATASLASSRAFSANTPASTD